MLPIASAAASSLLPKIADAILPSPSTGPSVPPPPPPPSTVVSGSLPGDDRVVLSTQSLPPNPPPPLGSSLGRSASVVQFPFQAQVAIANSNPNNTKQHFTSVLIQSLDTVKRHTAYFRDAWVSSLEAVVFPSAISLKEPVTLDLAWTAGDFTPKTNELLAVPASARLTVGGLSILHQGILPADLGHISPIVKSPIPYTNTPRLTVQVQAGGTPTSDQAVVYVRGTLHCSHPILVGSV